MGTERQTVATLLPDTANAGGLDTCPSIVQTVNVEGTVTGIDCSTIVNAVYA